MALRKVLLALSLSSLYVGAVLFTVGFFLNEWFVTEGNSTVTITGLFADCTGPRGPHQPRPCSDYEGTEHEWLKVVQGLEIMALTWMALPVFGLPAFELLKIYKILEECRKKVPRVALTQFLLTMAGVFGVTGAAMFAGAEWAVYPAGQFGTGWKLNLAGGILVFTSGKVLVKYSFVAGQDEEQTPLLHLQIDTAKRLLNTQEDSERKEEDC